MNIRLYRIAFWGSMLLGSLVTGAGTVGLVTATSGEMALIGLAAVGVGVMVFVHGFLGMILVRIERHSKYSQNATSGRTDEQQQNHVQAVWYDGEDNE